MKKMFALLLSLTIVAACAAYTPVKAAYDESKQQIYSGLEENKSEEALTGLVVNGTAIDTSGLPKAFYKDGDAVMVPALIICQKLGYAYAWDGETETLTMEDSIQKAILTKDVLDVSFVGKLKVIDLSGTEQYGAALEIIGDVVYVPAEIFERFFNNVVLSDGGVSIAPETCYITDTGMDAGTAYHFAVNGKPVETTANAYENDGVMMLPLRAIGEALGYKVMWIPETDDIVMENSIQKVVLHNASATAQFTWKLTSVSYTGAIELETEAVVHSGVTFVPASLFELFFNDISVDGTLISVSPSMSVLH